MKQLIVLAAVLPILLVFLAQFTLDQQNGIAVSIVQEHVYTAKEKAKQEGYFSEEIKNELRAELSQALRISPQDVMIEATETVQYRINHFDPGGRGILHYKISIPLSRLMSGGRMMGLDEAENTRLFTVEGSTASERLPQH
ncbi:MAG: hypothetical protein CVU86_02610 [Firmicutes bacterium HGW-Firmicutes-11]|jgi:hypothetical protein|nr:MAG: hypothetical protein CVU86_02610 [Firmicutes bacterium HGW-Firmicutes-11]